MTPQSVIDLIRERAPRVVVIGDFLLDGWWTGRTNRVAREAPAPVVDLDERAEAPGGAAGTAANLASLGARVAAVGVTGDDAAGARLRALLERAGVDVDRLRPHPAVRTTTKVRVVSDDQVIVRIDETQTDPLPRDAARRLAQDAAEASAGAAAQVLCDYGGVFDADVVGALARGPRPGLRVVDAHDAGRLRPLEPDVVTPNAAEAERLAGVDLGEGEARADRAAALTDPLLEACGARAAIVTLDRTGTVRLAPGRDPLRTFAHPTPEKQASGAGDVFVAALTAACAAGADLDDAAALAQDAADIAVGRAGTCSCSLEELAAAARGSDEAVLGADELAQQLDEHRRAGRRIVFTNGCFDVLHRGHTSSLRQARRLGDVLVVAVNADASVRRLKGEERPLNAEAERAAVLAALACVDYVTIFEEDSPSDLIRRLRPDVYAKGGDYTPAMLAEASAVEEVGGRIEILDYVADHSTTRLIGRIRGEAPAAEGAR